MVCRRAQCIGPILFLIYINDLDSGVMSWILKFADDTKIYRRIRDGDDTLRLQQDLDKLIVRLLNRFFFCNR